MKLFVEIAKGLLVCVGGLLIGSALSLAVGYVVDRTPAVEKVERPSTGSNYPTTPKVEGETTE